MTIKIAIKVKEELVRTFTFSTQGSISLPNVGEIVAHPKSEGSFVTVQRRTFEYGEDRIRVTLDCA
jgi:hypothetical protein